MASSTSKKVIVKRFEKESVRGYVNPATFLRPDGIEVLSPSGVLALLPYQEVKEVCFVREFAPEGASPNSRHFHARPKMEGLWIRMQFRDGDTLEGLLANNLLQVAPEGYTVVPPNPNSNNQKIFIPRAALVDCKVLAVIGSPLREKKKKPVVGTQLEMFD